MKPPGRTLTKKPHRVRWDDWVNSDRVRKLTEENKELAQNLKKDADAQRRPAPQKSSNSKKKNAGSDLSSNRGSEERQSSAPAMGRGQKRGRDYEIEKVGSHKSPSQSSSPLSELSSSASNLSGQNFVPPPRPFPSRAGRSGRAGSKALRARGTSSESASDSLYAVPPTRRSYVTHKGGLRTTYPPRLSNPSIDYPDAKVVKRIHHPALVEAGHYNTAKWYFYKSQNPNLKLMIAGVPMEKTLHPFDNTGAEISLPTPPRERDGNTNGHTAQDSNNPTFQEENFLSRPQIRIPCPDNLKSLLVDDWENVTKNLLLVPLPSKTPVNLILDTYFDEEKGKRRLGSAEADLLEEVVAGTKEYFDRCLGRILLYRFEREQFFDVRSLWEGAAGGEWEGKGAGDVYGAEHLARLFGKLRLFSHSRSSIDSFVLIA